MPIWINLMVKSMASHHFAVGTDMALLFFAVEEDPLLIGIVLIIQCGIIEDPPKLFI